MIIELVRTIDLVEPVKPSLGPFALESRHDGHGPISLASEGSDHGVALLGQGKLEDAEEADRHHRRLLHALGDGNVVVTAFEPDDGVNSPVPRGLVKPFTGDARSVYGPRSYTHTWYGRTA